MPLPSSQRSSANMKFWRTDRTIVETHLSIGETLKNLYMSKLAPLEQTYLFNDLHAPVLEGADFNNKPMVLLIGQYSTGKTSFIRHILERDFPGMNIGDEPTTDGFTAVMKGDNDSIIPGNALAVDPSKPFRVLSRFGTAFLNKFQCATVNSPVLESITLIDTPGILAGAKQNSRGYDFIGVIEWFAQRVDRILILFDAHKLDISDEFQRALECLRGNDDKIRIILNKADSFTPQQLMRVYGALLWSLAKVFNTPEVMRVIVGSFWDQPLKNIANRQLFEMEKEELFRDLQNLPKTGAVRLLNDLIKRARLAKVNAYIVSTLKSHMGTFSGEKKKRELISTLPRIFNEISRQQDIPIGDFPEVEPFKERLVFQDFKKFATLKPRLIEICELMLVKDMAELMKRIEDERLQKPSGELEVQGGVFDGAGASPFNTGFGVGAMAGAGENDWIIQIEKIEKWDKEFKKLNPKNGKLPGRIAKQKMIESQLPNSTLGRIWKLADVDRDGFLDDEEFALAMHLIQVKLDGHPLPDNLPKHLVPPSHRTTTDSSGDNLPSPSSDSKPPTVDTSSELSSYSVTSSEDIENGIS